MRDSFCSVAACSNNPNWSNIVSRRSDLYIRNNSIRSDFERDFTRIINSQGYRRLKHKTQVFFSPSNDHVCTRIEHVALVESISYTIANYLGLNTELTKAIAVAHDIGHSPFGHQGEKILSSISKREFDGSFWHEKNGLVLVDDIELLENPDGFFENLNLTYAVRDGIVSHCGEIDENCIKPRSEFIDLNDYLFPNQFAPYTWEGCVVKVADKISYLGRDIIDGISLGILSADDLLELRHILNISDDVKINNTVIINNLISDLCENSSIDKGLCFSDEMFHKMNELKRFNYEKIYLSPKLEISVPYFSLVLNCIFDVLKNCFYDKNRMLKICPDLVNDFYSWLACYWSLPRDDKFNNAAIFNINSAKDFSRAIILYISGMTDNYAMSMYEKVIGF